MSDHHLPAGWELVVAPDATVVDDGLAAIVQEIRAGQADAVYADEVATVTGTDEPRVIRKPGWSPRLLLEGNYVGSLFAIKSELLGDMDPYEALLRLAESGAHVAHVATVASRTEANWPRLAPSIAHAALARRGITAEVGDGPVWHRVRIERDYPPVTIVIPTRDRRELLEACIATLEAVTTYPSYDIVIVDNGTTDPATLAYLAATNHRVVRCDGPFNFSWLINEGVTTSDAPFVVSLNNDTEFTQADWLERLMDEMADPTVGAVGCRLIGLQGETQHEGIALGMAGLIALNLELDGYCAFDQAVRDVCAGTAAVVLLRRAALDAVVGFDLVLPVGYGDVDLCLRLGRAGWRNSYTPHVTVTHVGQASRSVAPHRDDDWEFMARYPMHRARELDPFVNPRIESFSPYWESREGPVVPLLTHVSGAVGA